MSDIDTSIVLTTCSRAHLLYGALSSLVTEAECWKKPTEIVVVNDGSTDTTADVLMEFKRTSAVPFRVLAGTRQGVAAARNLAAEHAQGRWLASFDDDQIALPGWLRALREAADKSGAVCVGGSLSLELPTGRSVNEFGARARKVLGESVNAFSTSPYRPASNNVLIRRDVFLALGGYDRSFTEGAEDSDLFDRVAGAGHALLFEPEAKGLHITPASRVERKNMRWTSLRIGAGDARRFAPQGSIRLLRAAIARVTITLSRDIPQLGWSALARDRKLHLDVLCSLWYSQGLLRGAKAFLTGTQNRSDFLRSLDFRSRNGERRDRTVRLE